MPASFHAALVLLAAAAPAQTVYEVELDRAHLTRQDATVTVPFNVRRVADGQPVRDLAAADFVVTDRGRPVRDVSVELLRAPTVMLTLEGSIAPRTLVRAVQPLFDPPEAKVGWVVYDSQVRRTHAPTADGLKGLLGDLRRANRHGTAFLAAVQEAVKTLEPIPGRKAVVVQASAADTQGHESLEQTIALAKTACVQVYTVGLGQPGKQEPSSTVLVLDSSAPAMSLAEAARRFIAAMPPGASLLLLPASGRLGDRQFVTDRPNAARELGRLPHAGEKAIFDAAHAAVAALEAVARPGRQAVVLITDGVDLQSRHRAEEVIADAQAAHIAIHVVNLAAEPQRAALRRVAEATGGTFVQARDAGKLADACEELSARLHAGGFDEHALRALADGTGGRYVAAPDLRALPDVYRRIADELESTYAATFRSPPGNDLAERLDIHVRRDGVPLSRVAHPPAQRPGRLEPELQPGRYLLLLALLCGLLALRGRWRVTAP